MPHSADPYFSIIVCTRDRGVMLQRCLAALADLEGPSREVVVVDNTGGDDETGQIAAEYGARVVLEPVRGLSRARNAGAAAARGEVLAYLDDDAVAEPGWLNAHAGAFGDGAVAVSMGRILPSAPAPSSDGSRPLLDLGEASARVSRETAWWFERANFGGIGFGGNMALRRRLFDTGFRFRADLGAGTPIGVAEETYALFTIIRKGGTVIYTPGAVVRHDEPASAAERKTREARYRRGLAAYLALLIAEEPEFRKRTLRYARDTARRKTHPWRTAGHWQGESGMARLAAAAIAGPLLYLRARAGSR